MGLGMVVEWYMECGLVTPEIKDKRMNSCRGKGK